MFASKIETCCKNNNSTHILPYIICLLAQIKLQLSFVNNDVKIYSFVLFPHRFNIQIIDDI